MIWLLNKLGIVRGVYLIDFQGEVYRSIARRSPFGGMSAFVYPWSRITRVWLQEGGLVTDFDGGRHFVKRWVKMS